MAERPELELDPKPYYVVEADEGQPDGGRYTVAQYFESALDGEYGGHVWNLAVLNPRARYSQDESLYRALKEAS